MRSTGLVVLAVGLVGCGPKIDPLHPLKAEVAAARRAGPDTSAPHARVALATSTLGELLTAAVANPDKPITVPVMLGTSAVVRPELEPPTLTMSDSPGCDCPRMRIGVKGQVDVDLAGLLGRQKLADDLGFEADVVGAAKVKLDKDADKNQVLTLVPAKNDPWDVQISVAEPQGMINDELIASQVSGPLASQLAQPIPLASFPPETPVKLAQVSLEVAKDPTAALWVRGRPADAAPAVQVDEGWAIGTTESAALAGVRAAFAKLKQHPRWKLEPLGVSVEDGTWTADLRVHKVARKAKYRDYRITGDFAIADTITITPRTTERTAKAGWGISLVSLFIDGRVKKQASQTVLEIPASVQQTVLGTGFDLQVERVESPGTELFVYGSLVQREPEAVAEESDDAE